MKSNPHSSQNNAVVKSREITTEHISVKGSNALFTANTGLEIDDYASVLVTQGRDPSEGGRKVIPNYFF